tara:strand:+ start:435 stop:902 length:468 start_codon:yes stop_codon:yes gene_type:complete
MKITKRQLKRIIREEYRRIAESGAPGWGYQGNTGLGSEMEYPEKRDPRENASGSLGELIRMAADAIRGADGDTGYAADELWDDPLVSSTRDPNELGFIPQVLSDRGAELVDEDIRYLVQAAVDVAGMIIDGDYDSSMAHRELNSEFEAIISGEYR